VYPFQAFLETDKAGYLVRQWMPSSLYDRIRCVLSLRPASAHRPSTRPFLAPVEKTWIVYQLLSALALAHLQHTPHGDIKSTNVLVSSANWIHLVDFAPYKPTRLPLDDPADFSFFYDTSGRRTCYLAPERFYQTPLPDASDRVTEPMDVFSAGCLIAEMFLDGAPLFSLSQLFKYRAGEYSVDAQLAAVDDQGIRVSPPLSRRPAHSPKDPDTAHDRPRSRLSPHL
jgi:phosphoinositide-3-kinase regulatory subunit 4